MPESEFYLHEGEPFPLGLTWDSEARRWNFAIYSKHAERVTLLLYGSTELDRPVLVRELDYRKNKSGPIWHCAVLDSEAPGARYYAYRVHGPEAGEGVTQHQFDSEKLLFDPYARSLYFAPAFSRAAACEPGSNEGQAPLGLLSKSECLEAIPIRRTHRRPSNLIVYEMHVRGFTQHASSGVDAARRGTFAGVIDKIPYLTDLGVTAVELMPIFQFDPQEGNYWGYMPLSFFAPHHAYVSKDDDCDQRNEFRAMVDALHAADIEVILDVVYNHTGEGNEWGPTYSYKGIDNSTYYLMGDEPQHSYLNFSGAGNTLHTANRATRELIVDSLRYWVREMGVDGFRFDLASIFTRSESGAVSPADPPIFGQISADPLLADIHLIAEPWDAGGAYQLGSKFPGQLWMQWNAVFRDTLQRFVRGDTGLVPDLMTRLYGSADLFPDDRLHACRPWQSINYVTSHDGFTLYDLVSYNQKRNSANGLNNQDGANDYSWNCGSEGDESVSESVLKLRKQQIRNFFCLLMMANGTPMFRMGDEFLQTQGGNNNPFNQDNETTWLNWTRLDQHRDIHRFVKRLIAFRRTNPTLSSRYYWRDDIKWYGTRHPVDMSPASQCLAYCVHGESRGDGEIYVMINASSRDERFGIHEGTPGQWSRLVDTSLESPNDIADPGHAPVVNEKHYVVRARSVVVLTRPEPR